MSDLLELALPWFTLAVALASFGWSIRLYIRQIEIDAEAAARERLIAAGKVVRDETPEQALEEFRAARLLLDEKGVT